MTKRTRKLTALILALILMLTCTAASAQTVYVNIRVDRENTRNLLGSLGLPEEQLKTADPVLALISALGVKVITLGDGAQIDLDLYGTEAASFGLDLGEENFSLVSSLFPNYMITAKQENLTKLTEKITTGIPGVSSAAGGLISAITRACTASADPGEPLVLRNDLYLNSDSPLISLNVTVSAGGERSLPVDTEGKTVLTLEDLLNGESEARTGLIADIMMNGISPLMTKLFNASPEAAGLITSLMNPRQSSGKASETVKETEPKTEADSSSWKTLADVLSLKTESAESSWDDHSYTYIFRYAGTEWLVNAAFTKELNDALSAVDFRAEDREEQIKAILGPCEILTIIDLGTLALPQEELDQWIGKTGQDLLDAGWEYNGYSSDENGLRICMVNGDFQYLVSFAEELTMTQVFGEQPEDMADAAVAGIVFDGKSFHFNEMNYLDQPSEAEEQDEAGSPDSEAGMKLYRLGTSVYTIMIPESFTEGERTEAEIRDDMIAYMRSDETLLDFDVYQFTKEGRPEKLADYAAQEAADYKAFEVKTDGKINGIDAAWYRAKEIWQGKEYTTLNYILDEGDQYVEIAFWLDGETAEEEAQAIIDTLTFIQR